MLSILSSRVARAPRCAAVVLWLLGCAPVAPATPGAAPRTALPACVQDAPIKRSVAAAKAATQTATQLPPAAPTASRCPLWVQELRHPTVLAVPSLQHAARGLAAGPGPDLSQAQATKRLLALHREHSAAFFSERYVEIFHESIVTRFALAGVFVRARDVIVLPDLGSILQGMQTRERASGLRARMLPPETRGAPPIYGHLRIAIARNHVESTGEAPEQFAELLATEAACRAANAGASCTLYSVEEHFVRLDSPHHMATLRSRAWLSETEFDAMLAGADGPLLPFESYEIDAATISNAECSYSYR